ncbi:MAG TPA: DUF5329 family protein [Chthoniobacterales bacterium]
MKLALLILLSLVSLAFARDTHEQARIDFLINDVASSKGIVFVRNGTDHDGAAAASHLRMKLNYLGERVKTAEEFIKYCASESSLTHQRYKVRTADGKTIDAGQYFTARLHEFDEKSTR